MENIEVLFGGMVLSVGTVLYRCNLVNRRGEPSHRLNVQGKPLPDFSLVKVRSIQVNSNEAVIHIEGINGDDTCLNLTESEFRGYCYHINPAKAVELARTQMLNNYNVWIESVKETCEDYVSTGETLALLQKRMEEKTSFTNDGKEKKGKRK